MGPRPGLGGGKSRPIGIRSPDRPARSSVAIPTELPGPHIWIGIVTKVQPDLPENRRLNHEEEIPSFFTTTTPLQLQVFHRLVTA